MLHFATRPNRK